MGNHLGQRHKLVNASRHKITVGKGNTPVYGMWFDPGYGYHVDKTTGIATGNDPESIYAVMSGKNYNGGCCFDYGNSENDDHDDGCGTMEAMCVARSLLGWLRAGWLLVYTHTPCCTATLVTPTGTGTPAPALAHGRVQISSRECITAAGSRRRRTSAARP